MYSWYTMTDLYLWNFYWCFTMMDNLLWSSRTVENNFLIYKIIFFDKYILTDIFMDIYHNLIIMNMYVFGFFIMINDMNVLWYI